MTPSPETHVFVGMFRPPWAQVFEEHRKEHPLGYNDHCEVIYQWSRGGWERLKQDWLLGHFDTPIYRTIEEVVKMKEQP